MTPLSKITVIKLVVKLTNAITVKLGTTTLMTQAETISASSVNSLNRLKMVRNLIVN